VKQRGARRPGLRDIARALRDGIWIERLWFAGCVAAAGVLVVFAVMAGASTVDSVRAITHGVHGTVTVVECDAGGHSGNQDCYGPFRSDDEKIEIRQVHVPLGGDGATGVAVPARVSGPGAGWATPDGSKNWIAGGPFTLLALGAAGWVLRAAPGLLEPPGGWPRPPKPPRTRPAQMGNRARRRRRKRRATSTSR
jgi:hypothetical protein